MEKLYIGKCLTRQDMILAVESSFVLGFQTVNAKFPVITNETGKPLPKTWEELKGLWHFTEDTIPKEYVSALDSASEVFDLDFRKEKGLEYLFLRGPLLQDHNQDLLPDHLELKMILPEKMDEDLLVAACNLAFRFGMEVTSIQDGIVAKEGYCGNGICFEKASEPEIVLVNEEDPVRIVVRGQGCELIDFISYLCNHFPQINVMKSWRDVLMEMVDDFALRTPDGQLTALLSANKREGKPCTLYGSSDVTEEQKEAFAGNTFHNYRSGREVYKKEYDIPWEVDRFTSIFEEACQSISEGSCVRIEGALSESRMIREKLAKDVEEKLQKIGVSNPSVELVCAYKQGFSWITEYILPKLKCCDETIDRFVIAFKPFLPEGEHEWLDENGATPSYHNLSADHPEKWYDLPIRYLQELYPVQDMIQKELSLSDAQIEFVPYEGAEDITYQCQAFSNEHVVLDQCHKVYCSERPYLDAFPGLGKVHPSTGFLRIFVNEKEVVFRNIPTDLEEVWDIYQKEVLEDCRRYIEKKEDGCVSVHRQPLFYKLLLDVSLSEPDERVGCREDLISSLDALHEDMYFTGSDYFKNYGITKADGMLDAPGLILPNIHQVEGQKPSFQVVLYEPLQSYASVICEDHEVYRERKRSEIEVKMSKIGWAQDRLSFYITTKGVSDLFVDSYVELLQNKLLNKNHNLVDCELVLQSEENRFYHVEVDAKHSLKEKNILDIDLHEQELIGYEAYLDLIEQLREVPGIEIFETATSYAGRKIYGIWLKPSYEGYLSMTKRLSMIPSEIINARHHANEVSSTNASFMLLKKLLTEDIYKDVPEKMNLILVPMENVDGAAIHYELQKEHPYWKFHVARFNSLGKEFYHEHFQQDTLHEEAMGLTRLYEKFVPDILVDNHGVPSHEWEQQFSGYTSPSYKGFWLPRSLLYGYFWYVTNEEYKGNYNVNKVMEDVIADEIAKDPQMTAWNLEWSAQFEKYAHKWMPKLFPADYYKDMINYWIPFAADGKHRYPSIRFPWITTVSYTSEVADETAQGEYLHLCAKAHVAHDEATIQMLMKATHYVKSSFTCDNQQIFAEYLRQRPLVVHYSEKI